MGKQTFKQSQAERFSMRENWAKENHYGTKLNGIVMCTLDIRNYIDHLEDIVLGKKDSVLQLESRIKELESDKICSCGTPSVIHKCKNCNGIIKYSK